MNKIDMQALSPKITSHHLERRLCCKKRTSRISDGRLTRFLFSSGGLP